jgi:hypothetical protein
VPTGRQASTPWSTRMLRDGVITDGPSMAAYLLLTLNGPTP